MVMGLDRMQAHFADFEDRYILIGGAACFLAMKEAGEEFRATKDLDIVLCIESLDESFARRFWEFVREGKYEHQEKTSGSKQFYRFHHPASSGFPYMLELFSRVPDNLVLGDDSHLTPIPIEDEISSLSAILLDKDYYGFIQSGRRVSAQLPFIGPEIIIPLKARAWLDLTRRREQGSHVDSREIRKHRNDVFRLLAIVDPDLAKGRLAEAIATDLENFADRMAEEALIPKDLGYPKWSKTDLILQLARTYGLD